MFDHSSLVYISTDAICKNTHISTNVIHKNIHISMEAVCKNTISDGNSL